MKSNSIKKLILYTFLSTAIIMVISVFIILQINQSYSRQTKTLLNSNQYFTDLLVTVTKIYNLYEQNDSDNHIEQTVPQYKVEFKDILGNISKIAASDTYTQMYYRTIQNQIAYTDELENLLFSSIATSTQKYETWQLLRTAYKLLIYQCNYILEQYLVFASDVFTTLSNNHARLEQRLYFLIGIIATFNYLYIARGIFKVLAQLNTFTNHARNLSDGNLEIPDIENCKYEELDILGKTFNSMKHSIKSQIAEINRNMLLEKQLNLLKQSQLTSLQQQMNPHFLYNTLNIISRLAMFDGNERVVHLMESTARILRYNMDNVSSLVPLRKELEITMAYIDIQQTRFSERIQFEVTISDETLLDRYQTPPMVIQPLIENSIKHGFEDKIMDAFLHITVCESEAGCLIMVTDNGKGIPSNKLEEIFDKRDSIGLKNVKERLVLCFPDTIPIRAESKEGRWTKIVILLPLMTNITYN